MSDYKSLPDLAKLSEVDPEVAKAVGPNAPHAQYPDLREGRERMLKDDMEAARQMRTEHVVESTQSIAMRDGYESQLRIFTPKQRSPKGNSLVILYFGGGFMFGNNYQCANYATAVSRLFSAVVVLPEYRLAPEHPFPAAPNDAWDSFIWITMNAGKLSADPQSGFVVGGRSAGGSLAAVVAQRSLTAEYTGPRVTGTWLSVPMLLAEKCVPPKERSQWISREQNRDSPIFNTDMIAVLMDRWKPDELSPLFSPFNASFEGLPTTYIQVCGLDPLRDDALLYERALRRNGVSTIMDIYPGVPHAITTLYPHLDVAKKYQIDVVERIGQMLGHSVDRSVIQSVFYWPEQFGQ